MNTSHTPGPWKFGFESVDNEWAIVTDSRGGIVANVNSETGPDATSVPATRKMPAEANARLISCAPDMLAELTRLYELYGNQKTADVIAKAVQP